ncbi:hypothetical protein Ancab_014901 [Ancistrocladus abbreviatus]
MSNARKPSFTVAVPLLLAAAFIYLSISLSLHYNIIGFFSSRVFVHLVLNSIIFAILAKSCRSSSCKGEDGSSESDICFLGTSSEGRDHVWEGQNVFVDNGDGVEEDDYSSDGSDVNGCYGSDGYYEDDDDNSSDGEVGWDDEFEEEYDGDLKVRVEAFIAKVINGWREELLQENNLMHLGCTVKMYKVVTLFTVRIEREMASFRPSVDFAATILVLTW